jgi:CO dehydrogenase/acetyl-CoA synthase gamma subunit (corrinoid Fe-S protein)
MAAVTTAITPMLMPVMMLMALVLRLASKYRRAKRKERFIGNVKVKKYGDVEILSACVHIFHI